MHHIAQVVYEDGMEFPDSDTHESTGLLSPQGVPGRRQVRWRLVLGTGVSFAFGVLACVSILSAKKVRGSLSALINLNSQSTFLHATNESLGTIGALNTTMNSTTLAPLSLPDLLPTDMVTPLEELHDRSVCGSDEELYLGLCYKKCRILTGGTHPVRGTSFSCCESHPCSLSNQKVGGLIPCYGFDVSNGGSCPHVPHTCLSDEELYLGMCYQKCSVLSGGQYQHRVGPATCCNRAGVACLDVFDDRRRASFSRGVHPPAKALPKQVGTTIAPVTLPVHSPSTKPAPKHELKNGGVCGADEELYVGLCYKQCSLLTGGTHPVRGTAFSCCESHPCTLMNQKVDSILPCSGFDVSGDGSCPHAQGVCFLDEELYLGLCYKKCGILSDGQYPYRVGPDTCCSHSGIACLDFFDDKTSGSYGQGAHVPVKTVVSEIVDS